MASYLSSVLTSTTSRYNNLRRSLLNDENDGDTEDDSHISRALRAYYVEKGRSLPSWLPPDPKSMKAASQQYTQQPSQSAQYSQYSQQAPASGANRRGPGLSDLFDRPSQQTQPQAPQSLRRSDATLTRTAVPPQSTQSSNQYNTSSASSAGAPSQRLAPGGSRPLPSQREGSYQAQLSLRPSSTRESDIGMPSPSLGAGGSAQDRLKARLWGGARSGGQGQSGM